MHISVLVIIFLIAICLELFFFNFRHYESAFNSEFIIPGIFLSSGLIIDETGGYKLLEQGEHSIEIKNINTIVNNLHLDIRKDNSEYTIVKLSAQDEGNSEYYSLSNRSVYNKVLQSQFMRLHLYGVAKNIKLTIEGIPGDVFYIDQLSINVYSPLIISVKRMLIIYALLSVIYLVRPHSSLHQYTFDLRRKSQILILGGFILFQIVLFWNIINLNPVFLDPPWQHHSQYAELTEALLDGHPYLNETPSDALKALPNPYDPGARYKAGAHFLHDHAYFNGKYYVYFGIGPVILFYIPYFLLKGVHLPTYIGIYWTSMVAIFAIMALVGVIITKWFNKTSFILYLLLSSYFINGCGLLYLIKRPDFYNFPILLGLTLSLLGLFFWISASISEKLSNWQLLAGSICMAMVATCRPQMLLASFLAIILFWDPVFKQRSLFSKKSILSTACFLVPFLIIAAALMYYNIIRFGSPLDFGANYNLTVNDMTKRSWIFDRNFLGIVAYLFQPSHFQNIFPFYKSVGLQTNYLGSTIQENPLGGVLFTNALLWFSFLVYSFRKLITNKTVFFMSLFCTLFSLVIIIADTQVAGILMRYLSDFSWLLFIAALLVILSLNASIKQPVIKNYWLMMITLCYFLSVFYHFFEVFVDVSYSLMDQNPVFSTLVAYLVQFWV